MAEVDRFIIYTDGGADPNPGVGGWGVVVIRGDAIDELSGGEPATTNNRMELTAGIRALQSLPPGSQVDLYTDSQYLRNGVTKWLDAWIRRGWQKKDGELKNVDLWRLLADLRSLHEIRWHWVRGHSGEKYNERADGLATAEILRQKGVARTAPTPAAARVEPADYTVHLRVRCVDAQGMWAVVVQRGPDTAVLTGAHGRTTSNRVELYAAAVALSSVPEGASVAISAASEYLHRGAVAWLEGWKQRGWRTAAGDAVKNADVWQRIDRALSCRTVSWLALDHLVDPQVSEQLDRLLEIHRAKT